MYNVLTEEEIIQQPVDEVPFVCNSCFCILKDFRYKCLSCPDFDLCEKVSKEHITIHLFISYLDPFRMQNFQCQFLGVKIHDHDAALHIALKLSICVHKETFSHMNYVENSIEDLQETLSVLDGFQFFYFGTVSLEQRISYLQMFTIDQV